MLYTYSVSCLVYVSSLKTIKSLSDCPFYKVLRGVIDTITRQMIYNYLHVLLFYLFFLQMLLIFIVMKLEITDAMTLLIVQGTINELFMDDGDFSESII